MSFGSFFAKVASAISNFFTTAVKAAPGVAVDVEKALETAAQVANNAVNALKDWIATPQGQAVESVLATVVPVQWLNGVLAFLPKILTDLGWAKQEFTKSPAQLVQDGISYATSSSNKDVVATNLATLQAHVNTYLGTVQGVTIPVQASLSQAHVVYLGLPHPSAPASDTTAQEQVDPNA